MAELSEAHEGVVTTIRQAADRTLAMIPDLSTMTQEEKDEWWKNLPQQQKDSVIELMALADVLLGG